MVQQVKAFGQILQFPDGMSESDMAEAIRSNEPDLNPDYKPPLSDKLNALAKEHIGVDSTDVVRAFKSTPSIADQAEASATEGENTAARQVPGAPVRQSTYNQALLDPQGDVPGTGVKSRIANAANEDIKGQADQQELELLRTEAMKPSESGFTQSALNSAGRTIKGAGQISSDFFDADKDNAITQYGQKLLDNNPLWVNKLEDIKDEPFLAFKEASGNSVPSMGAMVGVSAVGAGIASLAPLTGPAAPIVAAVGTVVQWLGPAAVAALPSYSGIRDAQILKDPKNEADAKSKAIAAIGASAVGAIEVAFGPQQWAIAMLTKEGRAAMARKFASTTIGEAAIKGGLKGALVEGSEEIVQNPIEQLASYEDPTTKENLLDTAFGGAMGALGGSFPGAVTGAASQVNVDKLKPVVDAPTLDDAIVAAHEAIRTEDPTLADVEALNPTKKETADETQATIDAGQAQAAEVLNPNENVIVTPDGTRLNAVWDVVDADEVKASLSKGVNQPRDRKRAAANVQVQQIANAPDYKRLRDSPVMDAGAPTLSLDNKIIAGNGRFEGVSLAYSQGTVKPYLDELRADIISKGLDPAIIEGKVKPILVRRLVDEHDVRKLAIRSNSGLSMDMSPIELASVDAERMVGVESLVLNDLGEVALTPANMTTLKDVFNDYDSGEMNSMADKHLNLSQSGRVRIRNAMLAKAYGDSPTLEKLIESTDSDMRNVMSALVKSVGYVLKSKQDTTALLEAVDTYSQLKATGQPVDNFLAQQDAFSEGLSKKAEGILRFIDTNVRSQKKLTDFFKGNFVEVDTTSADMFSTPQKPLQSVKVESRSATTIKVGKVGDKMSAGEVVLTASGREATPFPKLDFDSKGKSTNTIKRVDSWLIDNAIKEAESRGDAFNILQFRHVNLKNLSQSDKDAAEDYLFGQQPDVPRSFTKPMGGTKDEHIASLEKHLKDNGYGFTVEPASVRDLDALDSTKKARKELAEKQAKLFKKKVVFVKADGPFRINGVMVPSIADTIFVDIRTDKAFDAIMAHELSHWMEQEKPAVYKELVKSLKTVIINEAEYAKKYGIEGATKAEITKEIVGDLMGDNFTEQSFWQKVAEANPKAFKDIAATIIKWLKGVIVKAKANGMGSEQWVKNATKAQDIIAKAVAQYTESETVGTRGGVKFNKGSKVYGQLTTGDRDSKLAGLTLGKFGNFETGVPVTFNYLHNKESATKLFGIPKKDSDYGRGYEPSGKYVVATDNDYLAKQIPKQYEYGEIAFNNPLVLENGELNWKKELSDKYDGLRGKSLSKALIADGYDGVVTVDKYGTSEILDLTSFDEAKAKFSKADKKTIVVDGVERPTTNSEGKAINNPVNFWKWFGDSKVVDEQGRPMVVYHGTDKAFNKVNVKKGAQNLFWFSSDKESILAGESGASSVNKIMPLYVRIEGPANWDQYGKLGIYEFSRNSLDGAILPKGNGHFDGFVLDGSQVKSVDNNGDFSTTDMRLKFSKAAVENTLIAQHNLSVRKLVHADRMGALAVPSIAVTDKAHPLTGFGEITLLADEDFMNDARTFGADIYSTRYPEVSYDFSIKDIQKLNDRFKDEKSRLGESDFYSSNMDDPQRIMKESPAVAMKFLESEGIKPRIKFVTPEEKPATNVLKWVKSSLDRQELTRDPKFINDVKKDYIAQFKDVPVDEMEGLLPENDDQWRNLAVRQAFKVTNYRESLVNKGKVDLDDTRRALTEQIRLSKRSDKFNSYIDNIITEVNPKQEIFDKLTNTGTGRKYIEHNLDNVIRKMRSSFVGGENFGFGLGKIRGVHAPEFKSIEQIRKNKSRLMNNKDFEAVKADVGKEMDDLFERMNRYGTYSGFDNAGQAIFDSAKMGIPKALTYNGFKNVPDDVKSDIATFIEKLRNMPTEYFEAKVLRGVKLGEFKAAIVPKDIPQEALDILKKNGIEDIRKYKSGDNEDRVKQINKVTHVMFSRAPKLYSKLEQALEAASDKIFSTGPQVKLWLQSNAGKLGIKKDEIYWSGIDNWLDAQGKVSKQQVVEFVRNNGVQVEDVTLGGDNEFNTIRDKLDRMLLDELSDKPVDKEERSSLEKRLREIKNTEPKHNNDKLTLPGGTGYKELVVTVPTVEKYNESDTTHFGDTGQGKQIGWLRMDTRDGGLFIEELQSQRAQQGRSKGFDVVPPAPFVSDANNKATNAYITLLMKKALIEAVSNDHASVSWTTGDQQADRYDLSKQIDSATWTEWPAAGKDHGILVAYKDGDQVIKETIPRSKLPDYIGKPVAEKLLAQPDDIGGRKSLEGIDLKVGGEWAQSMYGNEQGLNLQGKPSLISQAANDIFKHVGSGKVESINGQPGFYVTPEMKSKDLPLFSRVVVDGVERPTTNSEGKPINNPVNFWKWFGDDANVDDQGRPKVLYHSTLADVSKFDPVGMFMGYSGTSGISLTDNRDMASRYLDRYAEYGFVDGVANQPFSKNVMPVYAKIGKFIERNEPFRSEVGFGHPLPKGYVPAHVKLGYDTVIRDDSINRKGKGVKHSDAKNALRGKEYIVSDPNQIKSAIGNNGDYSLANNNILFSKASTPPDESRLRRFQRMNIDNFNRFTVIKKWLAENGQTLSDKADVYGAEERYHSMAANQLEDFREQQRNPLIEKIQKAGYTLGDIEVFLKMQHAQEANAQIRKLGDNPDATAYGIEDQEAADYLSEAPENLGKLANQFRNITEQTKKLRLDAGILNTDITDAWEGAYKHYVPVKGEADSTRGVGKGLKTNFKSKRRLGHSLRDEHVIENILMDHERAILEVERNRVGKHLVMMAAEMQRPDILSIDQPEKRKMLKESTAYTVEANGVVQGVFKSREEAKMFKQFYAASMPKVAPSAIVINQTKDQRVIASASPMLAENEINVYMNGHAIRVQINDELLARAYTKMGVEQFSDIVAAGRMLNGYLSKVYTGYSPEFILVNIQRDFQAGLINLTGEQGIGMATKAIGNYPSMFGDLLKYAASNGKSSTKWIDSYRANGGNTGAAYLSDMERLGNEVNTEYASYQGVLSNLKQGDTANAARAAGRKVFNATLKWIYNLNQAGENAMRLAAFKAMIDSGRTVNEASKVAKNITVNFNRKGERQWTGALYLFYNASIQGTAATAHALIKGKHKGQAWALAGSMAAVGYMMAASFGGGDENDWDEINEYTKERNMLIKYGDGYLKVPVPYGYGFFWNFGRHIAEAQRTGELGTMPWHLATSAISEFTPFNEIVVGSDEEFRSDQVFMGLLPTAMKIVAQPTFNKQLFTGSELMPESQFDKSQPDRQKMFRSTKGTMYDTVAGWLDSAGIDVSPETLKYITRTGTGGAGSFVDTVISAAMLKAEGAELDTQEIPFVRKAYMELGIKDKRAAYYKVRDEARTAAEEFNRARRDNDVAKMQTVLKDKKELIALDRYANKLAATIDAARDQQDAVRADKNLSVKEKRLKLKDMEDTEAKFYDQYLDVFKTSKQHNKQ